MTLLQINQNKERLALARPLFAADVALALEDPLGQPAPPLPQESACLSANAVEKRKREFAAGRVAARAAMVELGLPPQPILIAENRAPIWPEGLVGSITHTKSCALAVAARQDPSEPDTLLGLGIDVEEDTPLAEDLWRAICSPAEQDWARAQANPGQMAKLIFSAKEAAYKCQFARSARYFGFDGMELEIDSNAGCFRARFCMDQPPFKCGDHINGRFAIGAGLILTAAELRGAL